MTSETKFRMIVRELLAIGIVPTPTKLNRFLGRTKRRKTNSINGREAAWRREELLAAGWLEPMATLDQYYNVVTLGRWSPPQ